MITRIHLSAKNIPKMDFLSKTDAYFMIYYHGEQLYKSEIQKGSQVTWNCANVDIPDEARKIDLLLYDDDGPGRMDDKICEVSLGLPLEPNSYLSFLIAINSSTFPGRGRYT